MFSIQNGRDVWKFPDGFPGLVVVVEISLRVQGREPYDVLDVVVIGDQAGRFVVVLGVSWRGNDFVAPPERNLREKYFFVVPRYLGIDSKWRKKR